jgi:hypothetical protein
VKGCVNFTVTANIPRFGAVVVSEARSLLWSVIPVFVPRGQGRVSWYDIRFHLFVSLSYGSNCRKVSRWQEVAEVLAGIMITGARPGFEPAHFKSEDSPL